MANEITRVTTLRWSKNGAQVISTVTETLDQSGDNVIENVQTISDSSEAINLGDVTTPKYIMFKNMTTPWGGLTAAEKVSTGFTGAGAADNYAAAHVVYIGNTSPADSGNTSVKLEPGNGVSLVTSQTDWYAIAADFDVMTLVVAIEA